MLESPDFSRGEDVKEAFFDLSLVRRSRQWLKECFGADATPADGMPAQAKPQLLQVDSENVVLVKRWEACLLTWAALWFSGEPGQKEFPGVVLIPWHTLCSESKSLLHRPYPRLTSSLVQYVKTSRNFVRCYQLPSTNLSDPSVPLLGHEIRKVSDVDAQALTSAGFLILPDAVDAARVTERIRTTCRQETEGLWMWQCFRRTSQKVPEWKPIRSSLELSGALFPSAAEAVMDARKCCCTPQAPIAPLPVLRSFGAGSSWSMFF